jgi:hypothetical protein
VHHGGALEAVGHVGELGEQPGADREGFVEAAFVGEIDGGLGEFIEAIVVLEVEQGREGVANVRELGALDSVSLLGSSP